MLAETRTVGLFVLYQFVLFLALAFVPLALVGRRLGFPVTLPGRAVETVGQAYDEAAAR
ncbi:MAG: hypothetical protein ABEJ43_00215 [Haloferacaceae archaeon]